jgi:endogenous inhibitor of DNA gyrase (YacG/DUF329 family)
MAEPDAHRSACPICGKPVERAFRPFCSRRCADVDLNRWLTGAYAIPAAEANEDADAGADDAAMGSDRR